MPLKNVMFQQNDYYKVTKLKARKRKFQCKLNTVYTGLQV